MNTLKKWLTVLLTACVLIGTTSITSFAIDWNLVNSNSSLNFDDATDSSISTSIYNWTVDGSVSRIYEMGLYYRIGSSTPEYPVKGNTLDSSAHFTVTRPAVQSDPSAVTLTYLSTDGRFKIEIASKLTGGVASSKLSRHITITNLTTSALNFHLFSYNDFELSKPVNYDNVAIIDGVAIQSGFSTTAEKVGKGVTAVESASIKPDLYEIDTQSLIGSLANGSTPYNLNTSSAGPWPTNTDVQYALQWNFNIPASGSVQIDLNNNIYPTKSLTLTKTPASTQCVNFGQAVTYTYTFDNAVNTATFPVVHNLKLVEKLPNDVSFISATDGGSYDPLKNSVNWTISSASSAAKTVQATYMVNSIVPVATLTSISSDETYPTRLDTQTPLCNTPPSINTLTIPNATEGKPYSYTILASDPDAGSSLKYYLDTAPAGMTINLTTGQISWTPTAAQVGSNTVVVRVSDGSLNTTKTYTLSVAYVNVPPVFTSQPVTTATVGVPYTYNALAVDPNKGDKVTYYLSSMPEGMVIDPASGVITWTPLTTQLGSFPVVVGAYDTGLLMVTQPYTVTVSTEVIKQNPNITWPTPVAISYGTALSATQLNATANVSGTFVYTPTSGTVLNASATAQVLSSVFTPTNTTSYNTVTTNSTLLVNKANQTINPINFNPATINVGGSTTVSATATSSLAVTFTSTTPTVCTVSGSTISAIAAGTCTIAANQAGNVNYNAATQVTANITPGKTAQTIGPISFNPATVTVGGSTTVSATATSGLAVTFTSSTPTVCTVSGSTVSAIAAGTCTIAANQAGNANYNAATQVTSNITPGKAAQTIGPIAFTPAAVTVGGSTTVSATATSGLAVTFTSTTPAVCTVSGSTVSAIAAGTCTIVANQAGNANYNAATQVTANITPSKAAQTIGPIAFTPAAVTVGGSTTVSATATSGLAVTFTSTTPAVCTVSGSTVSAIAAGTCTIVANQAGNANFNAATQVTANITPGKAAQTIGPIAFTPATVTVGGSTTVSAIATSGLAVTFTSTTPAVCTISGSTVSAIAAGTCTIAADQAGNTSYNAATQVTSNITPGKAAQTIGPIAFTPAAVTVGGSTSVSATASSGLAVTFTSTTPTVCSVSGSTVSAIAAGSCTIAANQAGNNNYNAATQVTANITLGKATQTINPITFNPAAVTVGGTTTVSATATSGLAVTFTSTTPAVCTISGSTVSAIAAGTCTIAADQAGNTNYNAATQVTSNITPGKAAQTIGPIAFTPAAITVGGTTTVSATASSGLAVTFTSNTPTVCTISGSTVSAIAAGTCTIAANQAGNTNYNAATEVTANITVAAIVKTNPVITWPTPAAITYGTALTATQLNATASVPGTFVYSPVAGTVLNASTTAQALSAVFTPTDTTYYNIITTNKTLMVNKAAQTIGAISFNPATVTVGGTTTVSATTTSGLAVTFTSTTPTVCTISGSTVSAIAAGTCTIAANQAGNTNYNAATQVSGSTSVAAIVKTNPIITWPTPAAITYGNALSDTQLNATASVAGTFVYTPAAGTVLNASTTAQALSAVFTPTNTNLYNTVTPSNTLMVNKAAQTIGAITFNPTTLNVGGTTTVSATATSGLAVTFTSSTSTICTVSGSTVTAVAAGTCTIAANQAGNTNYNAATQVSGSTSVAAIVKTNPIITWPTPAAITYGNALSDTQLNATASVLGTFVYTPAVGTVLNVGTQTLSAVFTPTNTTLYNTATPTNTLMVNKAAQTIGAITFNPTTLNVGGTTTVSATATSGLAVTFTSSTSTICTVSGSTVTAVAAGTCTIAANQAGNTNYNVATQVLGSITVADIVKTNPVITWPTPAAITYGTALSATQLNATANVPGTFVYTPAAGTVLNVGTQSIMASFNPSDTTNYNTVITNKALTVNSAPALQAPIITSSAITNAYEEGYYYYAVAATDPNGDVLSYSMTTKPSGMTINATNGLISWRPSDEGTYSVTVRVADPSGLYATQSFKVLVVSRPDHNSSPRINSTPVTSATVGELYSYDVNATDSNGDTLYYRLNSAPSGMTIDLNTGIIRWIPNSSQTGSTSVSIEVVDSKGGKATQGFYCKVSAAVGTSNNPPAISNPGGQSSSKGDLISFQIQASDPDGDTISYTANGLPRGLSISSTGLISGTISNYASSSNTVVVTVSDGNFSTSVSFSWDITTTTSSKQPVISSSPITTAYKRQQYTYAVMASDQNINSLKYELTKKPYGMAINSSTGLITWTPSSTGTYSVTVKVSNNTGAYTTQNFSISVKYGSSYGSLPIHRRDSNSDRFISLNNVLKMMSASLVSDHNKLN